MVIIYIEYSTDVVYPVKHEIKQKFVRGVSTLGLSEKLKCGLKEITEVKKHMLFEFIAASLKNQDKQAPSSAPPPAVSGKHPQ